MSGAHTMYKRLTTAVPRAGFHFHLRKYAHPYSSGQADNFTVDEVTVPTLNGVIAGRLWRSKSEPGEPDSLPVICTHGFLDNAATFDTLVPLLLRKPGMTFLSIDMPGHGLSSHWPATYYDLHMNGLISLARVQQFYKWPNFVVMGHSLGAQVNYMYSAAFPKYVDRLIAIDNFHPVPIKDFPNWLRGVGTKQMGWEAKYTPRRPPPAYYYDEIVEKLYLGRDKTITREGCKILLTRGAIQQPDGKYSFAHDIRATLTELPGRFTQEEVKLIGNGIKCPICVIKADPGSDYQPRQEFLDVVDYMKSINKNAEFHIVPGTHSVHLDEPHKLVSIITKFLGSSFDSNN